MINISELNSFPAQDGGSLAMLKEIAQRYCPEELQAERKAILPDEQLNFLMRTVSASASLRRRNCATSTMKRPIR